MAAQIVDNKHLQGMFGVTLMTLWLWRKGTPTKEPLPYSQNGRNIRYKLSEVKKWAKAHDIQMQEDVQPEKVKPGPKLGSKHVKLKKSVKSVEKTSKRASGRSLKH